MGSTIGTQRAYSYKMKGGSSNELVLQTSVNAAGAVDIPMGQAYGGCIYIPSDSSITTLTFYAACRQKGDPDQTTSTPSSPALTYYQLANASFPSGISMTVAAGKAYDLPSDVTGVASLRIVANVSGPVELTLKS